MSVQYYEQLLATHGSEESRDYFQMLRTRDQYATAVGRGVPWTTLDIAIRYLADAQLGRLSAADPWAIMVYETLAKEDWQSVVKPLVMEWVENEENVKLAAKGLGREPTTTGWDLVRGYCIFRLRTIPSGVYKRPRPPYGLGIDAKLPQSAVFVAMDDLGPENGFFIYLKKGEFVCVDSLAQIAFPPTGGGRGIFISLAL